MKLLICSDIHGGENESIALAEIAKTVDNVIILGDVLYHGPRNELPLGYKPKGVIPQIKKLEDKLIVAIRGNCDAHVDEMVLGIKLYDEYHINLDGNKTLLTHGHLTIDESDSSIVMSGHTHIPVCEKKGDKIYFNPGSTTIPKENNPPSYGLYEDGVLKVINLNTNECFMSIDIKENLK